MAFFKAEIEERLVKVICVEAETGKEAEELVKKLYDNEQIILTENDHQETTNFIKEISEEEFKEN